ncbi:MAG: arginase family protein [Aestuariivirga sp.]|nr:arginase family protein [Aestuariivirga sp.]
MGATKSQSPKGFSAAIFGAPHGTPYPGIDNRVHRGAPDAFRHALHADTDWLSHWDWDLGGPLLRHGQTVCDLGNLRTKPKDGPGNRALIEATTRNILEAGAVPIMFGGDDSVPIPFIAAYYNQAPIVILQIDAHIDWRNERLGETMGFSSTMRRASEHDHVWRIVQAGARGLGSAREAEVRDALKWGAHIVTSRTIQHRGVEDVLKHIPEDCDCVILLDCDALDSSVMPAVAYPSPGGLSFTQVTDLIAGVAAKARIAGFAMVEFVPLRDRLRTAAFTAARIAINVIGRITPRAD